MAVASASVSTGTLSPDPSLPRSSATFGPGGGGSLKYSRNDVNGKIDSPGKEAKREIPEVSVNGAPLRMPRPRKSGNLNNGNTNGGAGGLGAEGEGGDWGSQFWVTLVDPQVRLLVQLNIWNCGQTIIFFLDRSFVLCLSSYRSSLLGSASWQFRVRTTVYLSLLPFNVGLCIAFLRTTQASGGSSPTNLVVGYPTTTTLKPEKRFGRDRRGS